MSIGGEHSLCFQRRGRTAGRGWREDSCMLHLKQLFWLVLFTAGV